MTQTAAIYARYSSDQQRDASIEDQVRVCQAYAARQGWTVTKVFADHAISGALADRPGFSALKDFVRAKRVDIVLTESLDRLSRDQEHLPGFYKLATFSQTEIFTLAEGRVSELQVGFKGIMGALYLKDLAQKTRRGLEGRIRAGRSCGATPYGYAVVRRLGEDGEPERGLREINPNEAAIVRRIFREFVSGTSPLKITKMLNAEQIPGPGGGIWYDTAIRGHATRGEGLLRNPIYIGRLVWNRQHNVKDPGTGRRERRSNADDDLVVQEVPDLRIIDDQTWDAARRRLAQERAPRTQPSQAEDETSSPAFWERRRPRHLISGKVICGCCGRKFLVSGKDYMRCIAAGQGACQNRASIRRPSLEAHVLRTMGQYFMAPELFSLFAAEFADEWRRLGQEVLAVSEGRRRELTSLRRKIDNLVDAIAEGGRNAALQSKLSALSATYDNLRDDLADAGPELPPLSADIAQLFHERFSHLQTTLEGEFATESRDQIRPLIDQIVVHAPDGHNGPTVEIAGNFGEMLALGGLSSESRDRAATLEGIDVFICSIKDRLGALPHKRESIG